MVSITASTTHSVAKKKKVKVGGTSGNKKAAASRRQSIAPALKPATLVDESAIQQVIALPANELREKVQTMLASVRGESSVVAAVLHAAPHAASTTRDRSGAAADVAVLIKAAGVQVLRSWGVIDDLQRVLFPTGIANIFRIEDSSKKQTEGTLKPSVSALSLSSLQLTDDEESMATTTVNSMGTDTKRGKTTPPEAREGSLLLIRALCQIVGRAAEPYLVGAFLAAALDECGSASSAVRQAAEDTSSALVSLANPWAFPTILCPLFMQSLSTRSSEWRVKAACLERLEQCAVSTCPVQVQLSIPKLIPAVANQVWDTKAQVAKAAKAALTAICETNPNSDIRPALPAIVQAICKPAETNKAVSELMGTTFVVPVDASTLAMLCPVLSRALKEKLAIHKRSACLVISNMSKLVVSPQAVAPFGHLLVPELQKVANHVQFEEIRDEALNALANLTKALGESYHLKETKEGQAAAKKMEDEKKRVEAEKQRIEEDRKLEAAKEEEIRRKEEAERKRFKEAMDAQRELDIMAAKEAQKQKEEEEQKRDQLKRSTKSAAGKCQMCGLKKCKKSCMFFKK